MLKIGVIGAGHLGKIHLNIIQKLSQQFELVGFYEPDKDIAKAVTKKFRVKAYKFVDDLIGDADVVNIVSPTISHHEHAIKAIKSKTHVFIEKPITQIFQEAEELLKLAHEAKVKVQVGHVERFNPAFVKANDYIKNPLFIETHRLAEFNPRGTDVSVVLDLMIHDIDIMLKVVQSGVKNIHASGVSIVSDSPDIANARIEFNNGCVCNLTASRISLKNMRKTRIFQNDAYISIDLLDKKTEIIRLKNVKANDKVDPLAMVLDIGKKKIKKQIYFEVPQIEDNNAIMDELVSLHHCIINDSEPEVTINDGLMALQIAEQIMEKITISQRLNMV
ncbi:MAG: Gfo/Idh/MocA family oxidoreductase [Bacteroidota bacterium]|nr:Gfo/Idh/MocA family oxidoreductase [Bacteroidota bacterium]